MIYDIALIVYLLGSLLGLCLVFKKAGRSPWLALVPFWNLYLWVKICGKKWVWLLYFLIPGLNIFIFLLMVVETSRVFRRYSFWEQLLGVLFPFVYLPLLGLLPTEGGRWTATYHDPKVEKPMKVGEVRDWVEAVVFALIAVVLIRGYVFELFSIPSSSMEKSLLVGDHLLVSKMAYGPRVIQTPLSLPLVHNTLGGSTKSYLDWPHFSYHRYPGYTKVKRYDAVVFNFPAGDTVLKAFPGGQVTYYEAVRECGREAVLNGTAVYAGTNVGGIIVRPVDKREHYIKRCMGLPGETLQIIDQVVHINGKPVEMPEDAQVMYAVTFAAGFHPEKALDECGVSREDMERSGMFYDEMGNIHMMVPLSKGIAASLSGKSIVLSVEKVKNEPDSSMSLYPNAPGYYWSVDDYGPIHIPAAGETLKLTLENLPLYRRVITAYEGNSLEVRDGKIYINGQATSTYKVRQNYYWMMGDNRHCSQDSRFWGFVPEDHIAGKAKWVLWSRDKDHGGLRGRFLRNANAR